MGSADSKKFGAVALILGLAILQGCSAPQNNTKQRALATVSMNAESTTTPTVAPSLQPTKETATVEVDEAASPTLTRLPLIQPLGWLAIVSSAEEISIINASGKGWRTIYEDWKHPTSPIWSPDGEWIAFHIGRQAASEGGDIYIMRPDGSELERLTDSPSYKGPQSCSPDGRFIAFAQRIDTKSNFEIDIYLIEVNTHAISQLTKTPGVIEGDPTFSPKGDSIAFTSTVGSDSNYQTHLMLMDIDGGNPRKIMDTPIGQGFAWSPDGKQILFSSADDCSDLYIVNKDGNGLRQLTDRYGNEESPAWSPDGQWIAFVGTPLCKGSQRGWEEIYLLSIDGSNLIQLTNNPERHPQSPSWSPLPPLAIGREYTITEFGDQLELRNEALFEGEVLTNLGMGEVILVQDGPVEDGDFLWWKVMVVSNGQIGWVPETPGMFAGEW